jgi:hypothetical protein
LIGAVATKGEQFVTPAIDKMIGTTVQQSATKLAATAVSEGGADTAGVVARTLASRVAGSTVVGAVITTGVSAWENRAGLMHGDSKAIGNVVADTAVGAVAGLAVGLAVTYGAQISGLRNDIADGAAHAVDGIKSTANSVASGVSDAANSVAHFLGF